MTMNVATVILMDEDKALSNNPELHIIKKFEDVVIPAGRDDMMTLLALAVEHNFKEILEEHNSKRTKIINPTTLERTGNKVNLQPISIQDVVVKIK